MTLYFSEALVERFERRIQKAADKIIDGPMCRKNAPVATREAVREILQNLVEDEIKKWRSAIKLGHDRAAALDIAASDEK